MLFENREPGELSESGEVQRLTSGEWLWKTLRPAGCVLVLALAVGFFLICFTQGADPLPGYTPPENEDYYSTHLQELALEIQDTVLPGLQRQAQVSAGETKVLVLTSKNDYPAVRSALLHYFDKNLLDIRSSS